VQWTHAIIWCVSWNLSRSHRLHNAPMIVVCTVTMCVTILCGRRLLFLFVALVVGPSAARVSTVECKYTASCLFRDSWANCLLILYCSARTRSRLAWSLNESVFFFSNSHFFTTVVGVRLLRDKTDPSARIIDYTVCGAVSTRIILATDSWIAGE